ncbi:alpha/beta fold hydrolase [Aminobacter aminovorans]|uniref:2-hydroxy-6-oxonona-2,4-dienedioate hydrolase n=1 Tax=Aminobacter aminovorans TaxID=83263 RepID=A0AAC9ATT9_AMIAI|nr:alpha/beta hydrolase [Aminobacter aminovorans]AMS45526.1 Putative hydrolase or acyltransferase of alpha/beta superfamily [Aminobacter aminovorans]MBB3708601.1 2-hydroxy-6-oxonona-2,4-dienedioate hydrolase [Aminobacter aminovorans]
MSNEKIANDQANAIGDVKFPSVWSDLRGVAFSQDYIDAGGVKTRTISSGSPDKPLLLLLHGTGGHAEAFSRNFGPHGSEFWTVAIDMIGHGWTDKPNQAYEVRDYAKHILDVLAALGRKTAHISGESLGGWVAAYLAIHHPGVVDRLVLNTAGGWTMHLDVMERIRRLSTEAANDPTPERIRARLEFLMHDKSLVTDDLVETRRAIYAQPGFPEIMQRILCLQEPDTRRANLITREQFESIQAPTLVLWTSHDPTATPEEGKQIADMIPGAKYVVMNGCGHWPQYENATEFNALHIDFLKGRAS